MQAESMLKASVLAGGSNCKLGFISIFYPFLKVDCRFTGYAAVDFIRDAWAEGFEPPTVGLEIRCSIQLSYAHSRKC